jgi:glycosyltransferase involved in cell wall biosynthesis
MVAYPYFGYPFLLWLVSLVRSCTVRRGDVTPFVSFVIVAYNEEARIVEKLENTLKLSYPDDLLEIIVGSDCSTDGTDDLVKSYERSGIILVRSSERRGKEFAQKLAVESAHGEILVFSDVATILREDAIKNIVKNFYDPSVGCVSSEDRFIELDGRVSGEGVYVRYEMFLRSLETRVHSLVGLSGSFFAARNCVCRAHWREDLQSDFNTVLNSIRFGLRAVADPECVGYYKSIRDERKEFDRKVRTVLRGISVFMDSLSFVNPLRYPFFAWQLLSHKLLRWLVPFGMIGALLSGAALAWSHPLYRIVMAGQVGFYFVALVGWIWKAPARMSIVKLITFFVMVNASILQAWWRYSSGQRLVAWEPSRR